MASELREVARRQFENGVVYALSTADGFPVETTDTFLPYYTKDAANQRTNRLRSKNFGSRWERWMIGVSCMSGCPVKCQFCATGQMKKWRRLTADEIVDQVEFILQQHDGASFVAAAEHKVNYTRMGEPFLNVEAVREAIEIIESRYPGTHHYVSTIGIAGSDFSWIRDNITLQLSLHSLHEERRNKLIPFPKKMSLQALGEIRTESALKTTLNMTLVEAADFDIGKLREFFDPAKFFVKLSPINCNEVANANALGAGIISGVNAA